MGCAALTLAPEYIDTYRSRSQSHKAQSRLCHSIAHDYAFTTYLRCFLFEGGSSERPKRQKKRKKKKKGDLTLVKPSAPRSITVAATLISDSLRPKQPCDPWRILPDRGYPCLTSSMYSICHLECTRCICDGGPLTPRRGRSSALLQGMDFSDRTHQISRELSEVFFIHRRMQY